MSIHIGDVYLVDFENTNSNVQCGTRPAIIFQNNVGNKNSPNVIVIPLTSKIHKKPMPTHILIKGSLGGLQRDSLALCENPMTVSKSALSKHLTTLDKLTMLKVSKGFLMATTPLYYLTMKDCQEVIQDSCSLNN